MTSFADLPIEVILLLVDHVPAQDLHPWTLVSKQFYAKANPVLWREPEIRSHDRLRQITTILEHALHLARYIRMIDLVDFAPTTDEMLKLVRLVPQLEELLVQNANMIYKLTIVLRLCPHLTFLSLEKSRLSNQIIHDLTQHCQQLRQLVLLDCVGLTCRVFGQLATLPLEELSIDIGYYNGNGGVDGPIGGTVVWANEMALDLAQLSRLTKLTLHKPPKHLIRSIITTTTDRAGNPAWPHLVHLYLEGCGDLDDDALTGFIESHRLLKSIVLVQGKFTDATLATISDCLSDGITDLAVVNNRRITSEGIRQLICACPLLESFQLMGCGIREHLFPEAGDHCLEEAFVSLYIDHLDWDAIQRIQQQQQEGDDQDDTQMGDDGDGGENDQGNSSGGGETDQDDEMSDSYDDLEDDDSDEDFDFEAYDYW